MKAGDAVCVRNVRDYVTLDRPYSWVEYKADPGKFLLFVFLGQIGPEDTPDFEKIMGALGWQRIPQEEK